MVANLGVAQRKDGLTTLDVTLRKCGYQLWYQIKLNGEMSNSFPTLVIEKKEDVKLDGKEVSKYISKVKVK